MDAGAYLCILFVPGVILFSVSFGLVNLLFGRLTDNLPDDMQALAILLPTGLIMVLIVLLILFRIHLNYKQDYEKQMSEVQKLRAEDAQRVHYENTNIKPKLNEEISYYNQKYWEVDRKLQELYSIGIIHQKYQTLNAAILFDEYLSTGRCETVKECINRIEDDMEFIYIHQRIDLLNQKLVNVHDSLCQRISSLRISLERQLGNTQRLIDTSVKQLEHHERNLDSLEFNMAVNTCLLYDIVDKAKHSE